MTLDPASFSFLIAIYPVVLVLAAWYLLKKKKGKKQLWFLLGFLSLSLFYIFAPDPSLIQKLYVENGDTTSVLLYASAAAFFLFISVYFFKKHLSDHP